VTLSERPDLAPLVAAWRVAAFFDYPGGYTVAEMTALILQPAAGPREAFVLFAGDTPVGTAALIGSDLDSRPDLTPWLAGLCVLPAFRGRGYGTALVRRVEAFAASAGVSVLWLYTATAEALYTRLGWARIGLEDERGQPVILMRRDLSMQSDQT
jgi:GNAT superfamily N-acetyltransferase